VLGLGYGLGWEKFKDVLAIGQGGIKVVMSADQVRNLVFTYRNTYAMIPRLWEEANAAIGDMYRGGFGTIGQGGVVSYDPRGLTLPNGMRMEYPNLTATHGNYKYVNNMRAYKANPENGWTKLYGPKQVENIVQALARIVIVEMMTKIAKRYRVVLQVHDEIVILVDDADVPVARAFVEKVMNTPPKWMPNLPVACESGVGKTYGSAK
jgi:DNA polymerase